MARILFATSALDLDRTSGAIGACNLIRALNDAGHELLVLTPDGIPEGVVPVAVEPVHDAQQAERSPKAKPLRRLRRALSLRTTGYAPEVWSQVRAWREALERFGRAWQPDVVFAMGAGGNLCALMAMLRSPLKCPWIANYHDPYPASLRPGPYRVHTPWVSKHQERMHARILGAADALTFPSARLRDWVLQGVHDPLRAKAHVLPHIASPLARELAGREPCALGTPERGFRLVHTGTLLGPRDPSGLLEGLALFLERKPEARAETELIHVGAVHAQHVAHTAWTRLQEAGVFQAHTERVSYAQACALAASAVAVVVLEADMPMSPFLPQKLADAVALEKPVVALTPEASAVSDLMGAEHPLRAAPTDGAAIAGALERLWEAWRGEGLAPLGVPADAAHALSPDAVAETLGRLAATLGEKKVRPEG